MSTSQNDAADLRELLDALTALKEGRLSKKLPEDWQGTMGEIARVYNAHVHQMNQFAAELTQVVRDVGTEGRFGGQMEVPGASGTWEDLIANVNAMSGNLTGQIRNIAEITTTVANGDLTKKVTVDVLGELLELKNTINIMVDQLNSLASEVTRVTREVGTEGILGGQAEVKGVSGTWADLIRNVNTMSANLTGQLRSLSHFAVAAAEGEVKPPLAEARGETANLCAAVATLAGQRTA